MYLQEFLESIAGPIGQWSGYLESQGLSPAWSNRAAAMYLLFHAYGLSPVITSIYRSPEKQAEMRARYLAGDRRGLAFLPAVKSDHTHQSKGFFGQVKPDSYAIDIDLPGKQYKLAAEIAHLLGIKTGYEIGDYVHYFYRP